MYKCNDVPLLPATIDFAVMLKSSPLADRVKIQNFNHLVLLSTTHAYISLLPLLHKRLGF